VPRPADRIFLKLAVKQGCLTRQDADDVWEELNRLEQAGEAAKARLLCLEYGFMDRERSRQIKHEVRRYLERKAQGESRAQRRIAGYEIESRLGAGAMGVVYRARDLKLDRPVALKLLNPDFAGNTTHRARFLQEAQSAAALNHPNVVQCYDVGQEGEVYYLAMELVAGKTVKELIERRGKLDPAAATEIVIQVIEALEHAHKASIIHRDVKPANVMITRDGRAKLLDLGLARRTDIENGLTGEGKAIGTPYYMAPEAALDKGTDYRADVYSLGVSLFAMVTGEKPFEGATPVAVMNQHLKGTIPDARKLNPDVPEGLARVIKKMMAKRPADRYQGHRALVADLEAVLAGAAPGLKSGKTPQGVAFIKPRQLPQRRKGGPAGRRSRLPLVLGAAAAAAVLTVVGLVLAGHDAPDRPSEQAEAGVTAEPQSETEAELREEAAVAMVAEIAEREDDGQRERAESLLEVQARFPGTQAAEAAQAEARKILAERSGEAEAEYAAKAARLERLAERDRLREALAGYEVLAATIGADDLAGRAERRAADLRQELQARLAGLRRDAARLLREGKESQALHLLRESLALLAEDEQAETRRRIAALEERVEERQDAAQEAAELAAREAATREAEAVDLFATQARELVGDGRAGEALAAARQALADLETPSLSERLRVHVAGLEAVVALEPLAAEAFAALRGRDVRLERRRGAPVEGRLVRVRDGRLTVALSSRAEVAVNVADLTEREALRAIRRARGSDDPAYLEGVAALRLYRGDDGAEASVARAAEAGLDLAPLAAELRRAEPAAEPDEEVHALHAAGAEPAADDDEAPRARPIADDRARLRDRERRERERYERERRLADNLRHLFPDAAERGFDGRARLFYSFQEQQVFGPTDWELVRGDAFPVPSGQQFRVGLVLQGRNGRAEFRAPLEGDFSVRIRFEAQMLGPRGRLAITVDDPETQTRYSNDLGAIVRYEEGRPRAQAGESRASHVRAQQRHVLELSRVGDELVAEFDGAPVGLRMPLAQGFGPATLGLEWDRAALNLVTVEVEGTPAEDWLAASLGER